jgi:hypothetical protein
MPPRGGPLAPPIHPASRCSQLWREAGVEVGAFRLVQRGYVGLALTWRVTACVGCVPAGYPTS